MSDFYNHEADAWDDAYFEQTVADEEDEGIAPGRRQAFTRRVSCRYCNTTELHWKLLMPSGRWRLVSNATGEVHTCAQYAAAQSVGKKPLSAKNKGD